MTKSYFEENITTIYELKELVDDFSLKALENLVFGEEELDYFVDEDLAENTQCGWREIRDILYYLPTNCEVYIRNGWLDYEEYDEYYYFDDFKMEVEEEMVSAEYFDPEDSPEEDLEDEEYDESPFEGSDFDLHSMLSQCGIEGAKES